MSKKISFHHRWFTKVGFVILNLLIMVAVFHYRAYIMKRLPIIDLKVPLESSFDNIVLALFSITVAYPVVAQFIRFLIDDIDKVLLPIKELLAIDNNTLSQKEKNRLETLINYIKDIQLDLRHFHTFSEFKFYILAAFLLLFLSLAIDYINMITPLHLELIVLSNLSMLLFITTFACFLFSKIYKINRFLRRARYRINTIHEEYTLSQSEKVARALGDNIT